MEIALLNSSYGPGGASQIVANLAHGFVQAGFGCRVMVGNNTGEPDNQVEVIPRDRTFLGRALHHVSWRVGFSNNGLLSSYTLRNHPTVRSADVLSIHNLHGGYFDFLALPGLTRVKPALLTLHDMWAFTGHCVYADPCQRWRTGCGNCPDLEAYQPMRRDVSAIELRLKARAFGKSRLELVAISDWMRRQLSDSILAPLRVHFIPNGIDTMKWRSPGSQAQAREQLELDEAQLVILYVAHTLDDSRKGFDLLVESLARLSDEIRRRCTLLVMGRAAESHLAAVNLPTKTLGFVSDDATKRWAYAASDLLAFPSRADNLPVVIQEAMACGLPAVAYDVGGVPELVRNDQTGLTAQAEDTREFAHHLSRLLCEPELRKKMSECCRKVIESEYSVTQQVERYAEVLRTLKE